MSLVDNAMEKSYIIDKVTTLDDYGSVKVTYKQGAEIKIAYSLDTSATARIAEQEGISNRYTLTTRRNINLKYPDIVQRASDSKYFRITSDGSDNKTPSSAGIDMRQVEAEMLKELPNE